jgi:mannitol-1-phosphate/altronate dehydrogenase
MYDTNYHQTFAVIRDHMNKMKEVALKFKAADDARDKEFLTNGQSALFDILNERGQAFFNEYDSINAQASVLLSNYGNQISEKKLEQSQAWHELAEELRGYVTIRVLLSKL